MGGVCSLPAKTAASKKSALRSRAARIVDTLQQLYPDAVCSLEYETPFRLMVAVRLSAQCTDARVNLITPALFARFPDENAMADADVTEIEELIHSCGFYHGKARDLKGAAQMLRDVYGGVLPDTMEELLRLPGVGRKSANLLLGDVYGKPAIVADTHCIRISNRLGFCDTKDPYRVELALKDLIEPAAGSDFCHRLVLFGRDICTARSPRCEQCPLAQAGLCPQKLD